MSTIFTSSRAKWFAGLMLSLIVCDPILAQEKIPLKDLSFFKNPGKTWQVVGEVRGDINKQNYLEVTKGEGILVNITDKKNKGSDLYSVQEFGDIDLELDYMMAAGSNSGIYLQGNYEIQLLDSWTSTTLKAGDNGGIYERWDESKPNGQKGYEGYAPRQNVSRAPGLWQHLKISFQAPRFEGGKKIANARMLRIELNGVTIHENVELFGPTRGAAFEEQAVGPIRIQGDHGSVAFRNISITRYDNPRPELSSLTYKVFSGRFTREDQTTALQPSHNGQTEVLTTEVNSIANEFGILYEGSLKITEPGEYSFDLTSFGGTGQLTLGDQAVIKPTEWNAKGKALLKAGSIPFRMFYSKYVDWAQPIMSLKIAGPGVREYAVYESHATMFRQADPIFVNATQNTVLRSFIDLPDKTRVTHSVSVGTPQKVHYTYDLDNGALVQVWRGEFLDATPMWHDRGDGSSRPRGSVIHFGKPQPSVANLASAEAAWKADTTGTGFRTRGYRLDGNDQPTFMYDIYGARVNDAITLLNNGQGLTRNITLEKANTNFYLLLTVANKIEQVSNDLYLIDDKSYYLKINSAGVKPVIRQRDGKAEMLVPVQKQLTYSLIF